ncbi:MAG: HupE/UreJ family protein [Cyclobacteriaceae bacterium]
MGEFGIYFELGREHILDINGYDHILFVVALSAVYQLSDWKKVLILVTAFTIGHSLTLALAVLDVVQVNRGLIEFLIPVTIFITAFTNILKGEHSANRNIQLNYLFALFFGLIHGLGFSNYLKSILGKSEELVTQLFAFNVGLEVGQIFVVASTLIIGLIVTQILGKSRRDWNLVISSAVAGVAVVLMIETWNW